MPDVHAVLSASSASRWLSCPPSAQICAKAPDTQSKYAAEGTLAHEMCEIKLTAYIAALPKRTVTARLNKLKKNELYDPEMDAHTDTYLDHIKKIALSFPTKALINVEKRVDYSAYAPEGFGTADCIILHGEDLYIVDFKYGKGIPVSAENNPQLKLYALGAYTAFRMFYSIKNIHLVIIQPRLDNISEWEISIDGLLEWGENIKPIAKLAYEGGGEFSSGEHCRFCSIATTCRKRAVDNLELAKYEFAKPVPVAKDGEPTISDDDVGAILSKAKALKKWVEDIEEYALSQSLEGNDIPGWKAVEGRGKREWTADPAKIENRLSGLGLPPQIAYERELLSVAKLEKAIGKTAFADFSDLWQKSRGAPTLVPENDKRPAYNGGTTAAEDFKQ